MSNRYNSHRQTKQVLEGCLPAITHITKSSLDTSSFCKEWKEVIVKLLLKKLSDGLVKTNYRPVSSLGFISKVVGKVTLKQFTKHCNQNSLILEYQSAHRKEHNSETSLVKLVNDILWGMENQLITVVVILDLSPAFNPVDHDLLLDVLK